MEVASFLTSDIKICNQLEDYILHYDQLLFDSRDEDTIYFIAKDTGRHEIYYHYKNDLQYEFSYNFEPATVEMIRSFFDYKDLFLIDVSFKRHDCFRKLVSNFISMSGEMDGSLSAILLDDPRDGLLFLNKNGEFDVLKK